MPLRFLLDENQRGLLWQAILRHNQIGIAPVDITRVGDPIDLPLGSADQVILNWAEREDRILVTLDRKTMAGHLSMHLRAGHHSPGVILIRRGANLANVVDHLVIIAYASDAWEWADRIEFIP